jgi:hypothetical protein
MPQPESCAELRDKRRTPPARPGAVTHVAAHELGAAAYAIKAARAAAPKGEGEAIVLVGVRLLVGREQRRDRVPGDVLGHFRVLA